ncbi:DUF1566 domain-containing protein [Motiliproteus sp.]|uniref:Lcl C-terminal domain-containing protein n=1 Tax=Motiliproteus sp. TaxID=1898955 RepID=UPI003BAA4817
MLPQHLRAPLALVSIVLAPLSVAADSAPSYPIVDTGQQHCYSDRRQINCTKLGQHYSGQDAQHLGHQSQYRDNGDGTVTDLVTGLTWMQARGTKMSWDDAMRGAAELRLAGHDDWRVPTIKELYSLIDFNGHFNPNGSSTPFIDDDSFEFHYGDRSRGEREIDSQDWSATEYVGTTMGGAATVFGVNFADGRIKGYPKQDPRRGVKQLYVRYVRGNPDYGTNQFRDNRDGTISDQATALMWSRDDSHQGMNWQQALAWVEQRNAERYLGYSDWRLPNAKELQSLVDYRFAPAARNPAARGPAIDPQFQISQLSGNEYPFFWSSTTHLDGPSSRQAQNAVYLAFGQAQGWMGGNRGAEEGGQSDRRPGPPPMRAGRGPDHGGPEHGRPGFGRPGVSNPGFGQAPPPRPRPSGNGSHTQSATLMDVHGAGAQRSDPKAGNPADYPNGHGPQGDVVRINNYVRLVRDLN